MRPTAPFRAQPAGGVRAAASVVAVVPIGSAATGGAGKEDHALGVSGNVGKALDQLRLAPPTGRLGRHGGPHPGVQLAPERLDQLPLLLGDLHVPLGEHDLAMTGLHAQQLHRRSIMARAGYLDGRQDR